MSEAMELYLEKTWVDLPPRSGLKWAAVDLDGTLARGIWTPDNPTPQIGLPIWENVYKVRDLVASGINVTIHTSRAWTDYENIEAWLIHFEVPFRRIVCGKLLAATYIDDRAIWSEEESWFPRDRRV